MGERAEEEAGLGADAVAGRLGVTASTLHTWDRRYGIGPTGRDPAGHNRYTSGDLARLRRMQQLILDGTPPAEAAEAALDAPSSEPPAPRGHEADDIPLDAPAAGRDAARATQVDGLARAALAMDELAMTDAVRSALRQEGIAAAWDQVLVPVLVGIGRKHAATGSYVEVEHLLSAVVSRCLVTASPPEAVGPDRRGRGPVLLACAPDEQHSLPILALAAALTEAGVPRLMLGTRVPVPALSAAIRRAGAHTVFVWSQTAETGEASWLADLPAPRPPLRVVVGGPGWDPERLPPGTSFATSMSEALDALQGA
ncbi:MerR family transcriptional regulator [Actinomadura verrucosospora]|uniref:MerR family transcriptional regulator n=1 Tax=Actinomadura verrucosospora TaxID=46165 RepID=A0A7D4AJ76_ACTVE|nr:MerR family transcriptional regulator [Actinomadura verrucosospora]QKG19968.1 MerR family transcriptional regulator [Actinomadura verrucosospora]